MLIDRNAAAIVADGQAVAFVQPHFDPVGMAGHRLVHGVCRALRRRGGAGRDRHAADIHPRTPAHRFQPFQNFDGGGVVIAAADGQLVEQIVGHAAPYIVPPGHRRKHAIKPRTKLSTSISSGIRSWRERDRHHYFVSAHLTHLHRPLHHTVAGKAERPI
jgi:hypothetical protein